MFVSYLDVIHSRHRLIVGFKNGAAVCSHGFEPRVSNFNHLVSAYAHHGEWARAERAVQRMREAGLSPNAFTVAAMAHAYKMGRQPQALDGLMEQAVSAGVELDVPAYNAVIAAYSAGEARPDVTE